MDEKQYLIIFAIGTIITSIIIGDFLKTFILTLIGIFFMSFLTTLIEIKDINKKFHERFMKNNYIIGYAYFITLIVAIIIPYLLPDKFFTILQLQYLFLFPLIIIFTSLIIYLNNKLNIKKYEIWKKTLIISIIISIIISVTFLSVCKYTFNERNNAYKKEMEKLGLIPTEYKASCYNDQIYEIIGKQSYELLEETIKNAYIEEEIPIIEESEFKKLLEKDFNYNEMQEIIGMIEEESEGSILGSMFEDEETIFLKSMGKLVEHTKAFKELIKLVGKSSLLFIPTQSL